MPRTPHPELTPARGASRRTAKQPAKSPARPGAKRIVTHAAPGPVRPLDDYRGKRDFTRTPEPAGAMRGSGGGERFFCVQKHLASHLHYDFRLEHRGVLLSWAVPKGPSPDPATKRLAMQVEDHPVEYGGFEGVIPSGYGAGIVVLWDRGVWRPLVDDVDAALRRGNLPFVVLGRKLSGAWTLIRAGRAGPRSWLLIKSRDEWASTSDPTSEQPASVASGGDFAEVLAREPVDPWPVDAPVKGGATGALFRAVIARAAGLRQGATGRRRLARPSTPTGRRRVSGPAPVPAR